MCARLRALLRYTGYNVYTIIFTVACLKGINLILATTQQIHVRLGVPIV